MKKILTILFTTFAFMMLLANSVSAQMRTVSVRTQYKSSYNHADTHTMRVRLKATGTSDSDYPAVRIARPGARVWTLGELREFLPKLAVSVDPDYYEVTADNVRILRTEFSKDFLSMEIHFKKRSNDRKDYDFNCKFVLWCYFNEYGEITKSGERSLGNYYYTLASR